MARTKYPSDEADRFQVRLPDGMRDEIAAAAKANGRSMNTEIIARLSGSGKTLRDEFAMAALESIPLSDYDICEIAGWAYRIADAMMEERAGGEA